MRAWRVATSEQAHVDYSLCGTRTIQAWVPLIWLSTSGTTTFDIAGHICISTKTVRRKILICHNKKIIRQDNFPFVIAGRSHEMVQTFYYANTVACADEMRHLLCRMKLVHTLALQAGFLTPAATSAHAC